MIARLSEYISACPYFEGRGIKLNYLDKEIGSVSLEMTKNKKVLRNYADGGSLEQNVAVLALREGFGIGDNENQSTFRKCKQIEKWIDEELFEIKETGPCDDGVIVFVKVLKPFEIVRTEGNFARYEAEIEVVCLKR